MKPILEIKNISKRFKIVHQKLPYLSLRDRLAQVFKSNIQNEDFWALRDVSFEIQQGESVGIVGNNGAGKSTLLKILSRITPPTTGSIVSRGRIASLLEVGTGFHQELTGRENIFMNGSILGMKKAEIRRRFDEIIDFSGVENFLDTPLKHYSSGMQLRLAFAVAAHLEPEILIIDEVLAVGDAEFQKKCLGKMEDVSRSGRTILFVSHNLDAVESLCKTSYLFSSGKLVDHGPSSEVIRNYLGKEDRPDFTPVELSATAKLIQFSFDPVTTVGSPLHFKIKMAVQHEPSMTDFCLLFYNYKKQRVAIYDLRRFLKDFVRQDGALSFEGTISNFNLIDGYYDVGLYYSMQGVSKDVYDLARIQSKPVSQPEYIKPYEAQYRGFVSLN